MLVELGVVEQRYKAVCEVLDGVCHFGKRLQTYTLPPAGTPGDVERGVADLAAWMRRRRQTVTAACEAATSTALTPN